MKLSFTDRNELLEIRIGDTVFATGGGDLWTAVFAASDDLSHRIEVRAGDAAAFERDETLRREAPLMPRNGHLYGAAALNDGGVPADVKREFLAFVAERYFSVAAAAVRTLALVAKFMPT